jgi:hypothetical protein
MIPSSIFVFLAFFVANPFHESPAVPFVAIIS